ncbi:hypothetical protein FQU75_08900 [Paenibacillus polymyxa]|nr:hypothetical protein FQU75_08900 [Paenibacillus polymyxa]
MTREADKTIKGFLYQFNKTLHQILQEDDDTIIIVEGIFEDIDVKSDQMIKAIQCKYHESAKKFKLSDIYKPILQFLKSYVQNTDSDIKYILYAYFPNEPAGLKQLTYDDVLEIINTQNADYVSKYVSAIKEISDPDIKAIVEKTRQTREEKEKIKDYFNRNSARLLVDVDKFLKDMFVFEIGLSYEEIEQETKNLMRSVNLSFADIEELFYPNAIQRIAELSMKANKIEREICKKDLLLELSSCKKTAITRWTSELADYKRILRTRKRQLDACLNANLRKRYFIIADTNLEEFDDNIVSFINNYIGKYVHKPKLHKDVPLFIIARDEIYIQDLTRRLHVKEISVENGYRGSTFFKDTLLREPQIIENKGWFEFKIRLCSLKDDTISIINSNKPDDIFLINLDLNTTIDYQDINIEKIEVSSLKELEYLLYLRTEV